MAKWLTGSPVDLQATIRQTFIDMTNRIPAVRGWFGLAARRVKILASGKLQGKSVVSTMFIGFAKLLGTWRHSILELNESIFLDPPNPKGNRWVEHLRNTYRDYGLPLPNFDRGAYNPNETQTEYEARLEGYASDLVDVFRRNDVTLENIRAGLLRDLPAGATCTIVEPWKTVRPYPSASLYVARQLEGETSDEFKTRLAAYSSAYRAKRVAGTLVNGSYPTPASVALKTADFDEELEAVLEPRKKLLKSDLGSYTNLEGVSTRRYTGPNTQAGFLEITLSNDLANAREKLDKLKAAGVLATLRITHGLGTIPSTSRVLVVADRNLPAPEYLTTAKSAVNPVVIVHEQDR